MGESLNWHGCLRRSLFLSILAALVALASAAAASAATIAVTTTGDPTGTGDCLTTDTSCSLRQAIVAEDGTTFGGDTIVLASGTYGLTQGTDLEVTKPLNLQGNGVSSTTIDGSQNSGTDESGPLARILRIDATASIQIQDLTLSGGVDGQDEGCSDGCTPIDAWGGGALLNDGGYVVLDNVAFTHDSGGATPVGGAVSNRSGYLLMGNVSFEHDSAGVGGALYSSGGNVSGNGVTFADDSATSDGGGAAYVLAGALNLINTTVVNSSGYGSTGAIANGGGTVTIQNDTLSGNAGDLQTDQGATTNVFNTILATDGGVACVGSGGVDPVNDQPTGSAISGQESENIAQDNSCGLSGTGDQSGADPGIAPLADNGGPTATEALLFGSPALGDPSSSNCPATDQRGVARPASSCDIGAFEAQLLGAPSATTETAQNVQENQADLEAQVDFAGEAGGFHFAWGTSPDALTNVTPEVGAGQLSTPTPQSQTLTGLSPGVTYYYQAVADNASGTVSGDTLQFTTAPAPAPRPAITGISPISGPVSGGTSVTITGTDFTGLSAVEFGSTPASSFTLDSPTEVTATAPAQGAGTVDITVTTPGGSSAPVPADQYTYQPNSTATQFNVAPASSQPTAQTSQPTVTAGAAGFAGSVIPNGLPTTALFQYGLDSRYTTPGTSGPTYTNATPAQVVGTDFSDHAVGPVAVTGLLPDAEYHVRLVASNSAGTVYGPDVTFTTPAAPLPGSPILGKTFNASVVKGIVLIKVGGVFVPLTQETQIRSGTEIDSRDGSLNLVTASTHKGKTQHGVFGGAIFKVVQRRTGPGKGLVTLSIVENAFHGAPSYALCRAHASADASAAGLSARTLQVLRATAHGSFRASGKYGAATVRGTIWTVTDRCDGTLIHDVTDSVVVFDFVRHKTIVLHAGQSYLARPLHLP
jgi:IPT/TIG domain